MVTQALRKGYEIMTQPESELGKKMIDSIRENLLEKIGREEWNRKPLE